MAMEAAVLPMPAPLCLVHNDEGVLSLDPAALAVLRSVTQPVVVVAIAGLYRTGKSFLMNRLAQKHTGFPLSPAVRAQTKGIWMWCLPHPCRPNVMLMLLDTEGLGDPKKDDDQSDAWIFTLALLLSSTLVYNSMGTIDQWALEQLRLVTELTRYMRVRVGSNDPAADFICVFPNFIWVVRDFTLQLQVDGQPMSESEYLEDMLHPQPGNGRKAQERNELRRCLRNFFPRRKLFVLGRPAADTELARLEELRENELQPHFRQQADAFCRHVWEEAPVKVLPGGRPVTGSALACLVERYVEAIASGDVPCMESAVAVLARVENTAAVEAAVAEYRRGMEQGLVLPTASWDALLAVHRDWEHRAVQLFMSRALADTEHRYQGQLMCKLEEAKEEFRRRNEEASEQRCRTVLQELWADVELRLQHGVYMVPGGAQLFQEDLDRVLEKYKQQPNKGVKAEAVLEVFLREHKVMAKVLKAMEVQRELVEKQLEEMSAKVEAAKEAAEAQLEEQRRALEEHKQQMKKMLQEEHHTWVEEQKHMLEQYKKELKALLQKGLERQAAEIKENMERLQTKMMKTELFSTILGTAGSTGVEILGDVLKKKLFHL